MAVGLRRRLTCPVVFLSSSRSADCGWTVNSPTDSLLPINPSMSNREPGFKPWAGQTRWAGLSEEAGRSMGFSMPAMSFALRSAP